MAANASSRDGAGTQMPPQGGRGLDLRAIALAAAFQGGAAGVITDGSFYAVDSFKTQLQMGGMETVTLRRVFRGFAPTILAGTLPSMLIFFGTYEPLKCYLESGGATASAVLAASATCAVPASLFCVPTDVMKRRMVTGMDKTATEMVLKVYRQSGIKGFFLGWQANLMKDVPFAAAKISLYEGLLRSYKGWLGRDTLTTWEISGVGFTSGGIAAIVTNPLDTVNTRIKSGSISSKSITGAMRQIVAQEGMGVLARGVLPRMVIFGLGSSLFWTVHTKAGSWYRANIQDDSYSYS